MNDPFLIKEDDGRIRDKKIRDPYRRLYVGEDEMSEKTVPGLGRMVNNYKINIFKLLLLVVISIFSVRLFYLQVWQGENLLAQAEGNRIRIKVIPAPRGVIYDNQDKLLVKNEPAFTLEIVPADILKSDSNAILETIANYLKIDSAEFKKKLEESPAYTYQPLVLYDDLSYEQALDLKILVSTWPGIDITVRGGRHYQFPEETAHLLGYMGKINEQELALVATGAYQLNDYLGRTGLELMYEDLLKGTDGKREIEVDALGKEQNIISEQPIQKGTSLFLNLEIDLQLQLYKTLQKYAQQANSTKAAAVAINPNNGAILAAVSLPSFDNNQFNKSSGQEIVSQYFVDENQPLFFRAWQGEYPSGSTFKPIVAVAALSERIIDISTTFFSTGGLQVAQWFFPDWKTGGHGRVDVITALAESVNTFFYYIGGGFTDFTGLGIEKIVDYAKKFGLTTPTQVDFPVEAAGFLPSIEWKNEVKGEKWYIGDTYNASIGQGDVLVTPLQMAVAYSAIVNGGNIYAPRLVKAIKDENSGEVEELGPKLLEANIIDSQYLLPVKQGLKAAVAGGSARYLSLLPVASGGKTGTAQVGGDKKPHAWFVGFAPYANPEIVLAVVIENGGEGATYAVPVAFDIFNWYFNK